MGRSVPGAKAPVASHDNMRPAPGRKAPGGVPGCVPPLYISLASPAPAHPPLPGGIPQVAGRHTGALTQLRPHDRVDRPPRRLPRVPTASPRPALTAVPARRGPPLAAWDTRAARRAGPASVPGGVPPGAPPSARLTARDRARFARLRQRIAPRMRGGANCHRSQFQLRPEEKPVP
jgi:hypothetical protein